MKSIFKNKKTILSVVVSLLVITEVASVFLAVSSFNHKNDIKSYTVNVGDPINKNMFAILVNDGSGNYNETYEENFPSTSTYTFNEALSKCVDLDDNVVSDSLAYNSSTGQITLSSTTTVYCYLYYDKK